MSTNNVWGQETQFFYSLTPDVIDLALSSLEIRPSGRVMALNSLENRVYEVEVESFDVQQGPFCPNTLILKFYRPGRWKSETLLEEHSYIQELHHAALNVICPLTFSKKTLFQESRTGLYYAIFPKVKGRLKDELNNEEIKKIGELIGKIHQFSKKSVFKNRIELTVHNFIEGHFDILEKAKSFLPSTQLDHYLTLVKNLIPIIKQSIQNLPSQRIHGDLHRGNILWTQSEPWILDFDDSMMGPKEQDLWQLMPGRDEYSLKDRQLFIHSYNSVVSEPAALSNQLIEALRTMRMINFNGWIARRWEDPTFKRSYPNFDSINHWETQCLDLKEQTSLLNESHYYTYH